MRSEVSASNFTNLPVCVTSVQHVCWSTCTSMTGWLVEGHVWECMPGYLSAYICVWDVHPEEMKYSLCLQIYSSMFWPSLELLISKDWNLDLMEGSGFFFQHFLNFIFEIIA